MIFSDENASLAQSPLLAAGSSEQLDLVSLHLEDSPLLAAGSFKIHKKDNREWRVVKIVWFFEDRREKSVVRMISVMSGHVA